MLLECMNEFAMVFGSSSVNKSLMEEVYEYMKKEENCKMIGLYYHRNKKVITFIPPKYKSHQSAFRIAQRAMEKLKSAEAFYIADCETYTGQAFSDYVSGDWLKEKLGFKVYTKKY